jgi:hypothetical protein
VIVVFHVAPFRPIGGLELILLRRGGEGRGEEPIARGEYTFADCAPQFNCDVGQLVFCSQRVSDAFRERKAVLRLTWSRASASFNAEFCDALRQTVGTAQRFPGSDEPPLRCCSNATVRKRPESGHA